MAQTSDRVSSIAARYIGMSNTDLKKKVETRDGIAELGHDLRALAASALRQDEVRGIRKLFKKVLG